MTMARRLTYHVDTLNLLHPASLTRYTVTASVNQLYYAVYLEINGQFFKFALAAHMQDCILVVF